MKRVLLKLSGEALAGDKKTGFDEATCMGVAKQVKQLPTFTPALITFPHFSMIFNAFW